MSEHDCRESDDYFGSNAPDPRDAEIAAQRAEIKRMCEERDSAQKCIERLTARVEKLEAVARAAWEVCDEADDPEAAIVRLDDALAVAEVQRG